jgi:hypothetical protein
MRNEIANLNRPLYLYILSETATRYHAERRTEVGNLERFSARIDCCGFGLSKFAQGLHLRRGGGLRVRRGMGFL